MTRRPAPVATRRGVLGGALAVAAVGAGGDAGPGAEPSGSPSASGADPSPLEAATPEPDPDARLVRRVVDDLTGALALVGGAARARGGAGLAPWTRMHRAHLAALEAPTRVRPQRSPGPAAALRTRVRREEAGLQRRLAAAAVEAESGALASLLATMSAAVAQQLVLDDERGRP